MEPAAIRETGRVPHGGATDPGVLDLSANVNPRVPDGVAAAYEETLEASRRYPDDDYPAFREAAAASVGCDPRDVVPTPGGLAAIRLAIEATVAADDEVLVPAPSFGEYAREVRLQGAEPRFVPHDDLVSSGVEDAALAIVCTPNNPTGEAADPKALEAFARRCAGAGTPVLVDEAFLGFTDLPSAASFDLENVIVARSLTKLFGLPGLRAGFAVARGDHREALQAARPPWYLGTPAARVGAHCLQQESFVAETRGRVREERARLRQALADRFGFDVRQSDAPFLLCDVGELDGCDRGDSGLDVDALLAGVREEGVVLRDARTFRGLDSHVRIAVRDREATDRLCEALEAIDLDVRG